MVLNLVSLSDVDELDKSLQYVSGATLEDYLWSNIWFQCLSRNPIINNIQLAILAQRLLTYLNCQYHISFIYIFMYKYLVPIVLLKKFDKQTLVLIFIIRY